jgi:hypothetical protein
MRWRGRTRPLLTWSLTRPLFGTARGQRPIQAGRLRRLDLLRRRRAGRCRGRLGTSADPSCQVDRGPPGPSCSSLPRLNCVRWGLTRGEARKKGGPRWPKAA